MPAQHFWYQEMALMMNGGADQITGLCQFCTIIWINFLLDKKELVVKKGHKDCCEVSTRGEDMTLGHHLKCHHQVMISLISCVSSGLPRCCVI